MAGTKIRPQPKCRIIPGPGLYLVLKDNAALSYGNDGAGGPWVHMFTMDEASQCLVPLDIDEQGPYYMSHWPACVAFCHGKPGLINQFLRQGGGTEKWLPVPALHARPVIYGMLDAIARAPANRDGKTDPTKPYDISALAASGTGQARFSRILSALLGDEKVGGPLLDSAWEGRNLLEHALRVRLFDVAEVLWNAGMRFGESNMREGLLFRDFADPAIDAGLGVGLYCACKNLTIVKDTDGYEPSHGEVYCNMVEKWLERFGEEGGRWPIAAASLAWRTGQTRKSIQGDLLCIPLELQPHSFRVEGHVAEDWPQWIQDKWTNLWGKMARKYAPANIINSSVTTTVDRSSTEVSLGAWLRGCGHSTLAAQLESNGLRAGTNIPADIAGKHTKRF